MKKHLKWIIPVICIALVFASAGGYFHLRSNRVPTDIVYVHSDTDVNLNDPREVIGVSEYVFIGYVQETHDYFMELESREFPESVKTFDNPCTECVVKIIKNIKGELKEGETFSFYQMAGITKDRKYIEMEENDLIPEVGKYYIFTGISHSDGTITGGGENGTIELEADINESNITESAFYQKYLKAYENQILPKNKGIYPDYLATADVNYDALHNQKLEEEYNIKQAELDRQYALEQTAAE